MVQLQYSNTDLLVLFQAAIHFSKTFHLLRILLSAHSTRVFVTKTEVSWLCEVDQ